MVISMKPSLKPGRFHSAAAARWDARAVSPAHRHASISRCRQVLGNQAFTFVGQNPFTGARGSCHDIGVAQIRPPRAIAKSDFDGLSCHTGGKGLGAADHTVLALEYASDPRRNISHHTFVAPPGRSNCDARHSSDGFDVSPELTG